MSDLTEQAAQGAKEIGSSSAADAKTEEMIPYTRFKEVNDKAKDYEKRLKDLEGKINSQAEAKMIEENNLKGLLEKYKSDLDNANSQLAPLLEQKTKMDDFLDKQKNALLEKLPEHLREKGASLDLDTLSVFAEEFAKPGSKSTSNFPDATKKAGNFNGFESLAEWAEKDPHSYAVAKANGKIRIS